MRRSFYLQNLMTSSSTQTDQMPHFQKVINERQSLQRVNRTFPDSKTLERFYGRVELEFELDKTKGICTLFDNPEALGRLKAIIYKKVYNNLVEETQENSNTVTESIEFEVNKFETLGREFYNLSERKNFQCVRELRNYLIGKSKPFFEMRDYKVYNNSRGRPVDVLFMKIFSRNLYLSKISLIVNKLVD